MLISNTPQFIVQPVRLVELFLYQLQIDWMPQVAARSLTGQKSSWGNYYFAVSWLTSLSSCIFSVSLRKAVLSPIT